MVRRMVRVECTDIDDQWRLLQETYKLPASLLHAVRVKVTLARDKCHWDEWRFWSATYERLLHRILN